MGDYPLFGYGLGEAQGNVGPDIGRKGFYEPLDRFVEFGKGDAHWWRLPLYDSALVSAADGSGKNIYTRDRAKYRRMLRESVRLHAELRRRWPELQRQYRAALPNLVSAESWQQVFEEKA